MSKNSNLIKRTTGEYIFDVFNTILLGLFCVLALYPVLYVLFASLSDGNLLVAHTGLLLWPLKPNIKAFELVFKNQLILIGFKNTIFVVIVGTIMNLVFTSVGAYFMAQKNVMFQARSPFPSAFTMFCSFGIIPFWRRASNLKHH